MDEQPKQPDMIDTTDCLEAINVFKSMKNFMFVAIVLCLLALGAVFWADNAGWIDKSECVCGRAVCAVNTEPAGEGVSEPATPVAEAAKIAAEQVTAVQTSQDEKVATAVMEEEKTGIFKGWQPKCVSIMMLIKACNFILILAAVLYSLTLLMSLKISLTGRLGGINHISRAFFISLFALVILLPWQVMLPGVVVGAIYQPAELLCRTDGCCGSGKAGLCRETLFYLRFVGLWLVVLWMYVLTQIRSGKWARATLRRLGIVR